MDTASQQMSVLSDNWGKRSTWLICKQVVSCTWQAQKMMFLQLAFLSGKKNLDLHHTSQNTDQQFNVMEYQSVQWFDVMNVLLVRGKDNMLKISSNTWKSIVDSQQCTPSLAQILQKKNILMNSTESRITERQQSTGTRSCMNLRRERIKLYLNVSLNTTSHSTDRVVDPIMRWERTS